MIGDIIILIMEWIGTISFAVSGSLVAIRCSLDLFGVATVGCITAVGGGVIRDVLLGNTPPKIFFNPLIFCVAVVTSVLVFIITDIHRRNFKKLSESIDVINIFFDALGLAAFSITGVEIACRSSYENNALLAITLGVITGVGGGILRDVLVNEKPYVLTKHIYAVVSIVGCCFYYLVGFRAGLEVFATFFVIIFTVLIRILAAKLHWRLPKIDLNEEQ